jgi:hypothetical protein
VEDFNYFDDDGASPVAVDGAFQQTDATPNTYQDEWDFYADEIVAQDHNTHVIEVGVLAQLGSNGTETMWQDDFLLVDQGDQIDDPFLPSDEWSSAVNANAPPYVVEDAWDWASAEVEPDDIFLITDDDDDAVAPPSAQSAQDFGTAPELLDEELGTFLLVDQYQQADSTAPVVDVVLDEAWDWFGDQADDDLQLIIDDDDDAVGPNVVVAASQLFEDAPTFDDGEIEEFFADHFGNEEADPQSLDDPWDWFADAIDDDLQLIVDDDDDAVGPNGTAPLPSLTYAEEFFEASEVDDEWHVTLDAFALVNGPQASTDSPFDDAWNWQDEIEEISIDDGNAFVDVVQPAAQIFEDAWVWDDESTDELAIDAQLGANFIPPPPSQFTDDAWDWTEHLEVEDSIDVELMWATLPLLVASHWVVRRRRRRLFTISRRKHRAFEVSAVSSKRFDEKDPAEKVPLTFDFTVDLPDGVLLTSIQSVTFSTAFGTDVSPSALANGPAGFDATSKKVIVPVQGGLDGRDYNVSVVALTSESDLVLELNGVLPVRS